MAMMIRKLALLEVIGVKCHANKALRNRPEELTYIHSAIRNISTVSFVDHRFILAIIMQEVRPSSYFLCTSNLLTVFYSHKAAST